jgi:hypothetical protein
MIKFAETYYSINYDDFGVLALVSDLQNLDGSYYVCQYTCKIRENVYSIKQLEDKSTF